MAHAPDSGITAGSLPRRRISSCLHLTWRRAMAGRIETRLKELSITLPDAPTPAANYVPVSRAGNLLFIAGQIPMEGGKAQFIGKLGQDLKVEDGQKSA